MNSEVYETLNNFVKNERWADVIESFIDAELLGFSTVTIITKQAIEYQAVTEILARTNWRMGSYMTTGRPYAMENSHVWMLTNEPEPEVVIEEVDFFDKKDPVNWEDVVQVKPEEAKELLERGYEYTAKWKGLVELTKFKNKKPLKESLEEQLEREADEKYRDEHELALDGKPIVYPNEEELTKKLGHEAVEAMKDIKIKVIDHSHEPEKCPGEDNCLIERGPNFDAILALTVCPGCSKYKAWLGREEV